jgi:glutaredoxin
MPEKLKVIIYSRPDCHLCGVAKAVIGDAGCSDLFELQEVNIETDPELIARYGYDIPVIMINGTEAFRHRVTTEAFRQRILGGRPY